MPPGEIRLTVAAPRYEEKSVSLSADADTHVEVALPHAFRMQWGPVWGSFGPQLTIDLPVRHGGTMTYSAFLCAGGCSASENIYNCAEVRDDTGRVVHVNPCGHYDVGVAGSLTVAGGHTYYLLLRQCSEPPGQNIFYYGVTVRRPI